MSKVMFDQLPVADIQAIQTANRPDVVNVGNAEFIQQLRTKATQTVPVTLSNGQIVNVGKQLEPVYVELTADGNAALFGFRRAKRDESGKYLETPKFYLGSGKDKVGYVSDHNNDNRSPIDSNLAKLSKAVKGDRFVTTPETWIFLDDGECGSAQHRGWTIYERQVADPNYKPVVCISFGFSAAMADVLDRAAKRTTAAIAIRNNFIEDELLVDRFGQPYPNPEHLRGQLGRELSTALKIVKLRSEGKDIKAGGEFTQQDIGDMLQHCPNAPAVLCKVHRYGLDSKGDKNECLSLFGRANIAAALILSQNIHQSADYVVDGRKRVFTLPDEIATPNDEFIEGFLQAAGSALANSPFAEVYQKWDQAGKKHPQRKFGVLVGMIKHYMATSSVVEIPPPVDDATGQPLPGAETKLAYTCKPCEFSTVDPGTPNPGTPYRHNNFGGLDIGALGKV